MDFDFMIFEKMCHSKEAKSKQIGTKKIVPLNLSPQNRPLWRITITKILSKFATVFCSLEAREKCIRRDLDSSKSNLQLLV